MVLSKFLDYFIKFLINNIAKVYKQGIDYFIKFIINNIAKVYKQGQTTRFF
jgi:hypothetical protein